MPTTYPTITTAEVVAASTSKRANGYVWLRLADHPTKVLTIDRAFMPDVAKGDEITVEVHTPVERTLHGSSHGWGALVTEVK